MHKELFARPVGAETLRGWLADGQEIALIDVRDGAVFSESHLLVASNVPLATLEIRAPQLLPRKTVRLVIVDGGESMSLSCKAADILQRHGYSDIHVLEGGTAQWMNRGHRLFSGIHVPSKAFGEYIEHSMSTPRIDSATLHAWMQSGREFALFDSRPQEEFSVVSVPGATDCPGAELVYRVPGLLRSPDVPVVVNCAGRTRSIIGAQSLRDAGLANPVFALENGTMGWQLAGLQVETGRSNIAQEPHQEALLKAMAMAKEVAERSRLRFISVGELESMLSQVHRTTYVFDVRLPSEYAEGHHPGSVNAPGGQLVQATDAFAAVRGARIVLVDRHEVQAVMTGHWLQKMGWHEIFILRAGLGGMQEVGSSPVSGLGESQLRCGSVDAAELSRLMSTGIIHVIDVGESYWYRKARIPGSYFAMRSKLPQVLERFGKQDALMFTCGDGRLSRYAAEDASVLGYENVRYLEGGRAGWRAAGNPTEQCAGDGDPKLLTETTDMWYPPFARSANVAESMKQYLTWEVDLLEQVRDETYFSFGGARSAM